MEESLISRVLLGEAVCDAKDAQIRVGRMEGGHLGEEVLREQECDEDLVAGEGG